MLRHSGGFALGAGGECGAAGHGHAPGAPGASGAPPWHVASAVCAFRSPPPRGRAQAAPQTPLPPGCARQPFEPAVAAVGPVGPSGWAAGGGGAPHSLAQPEWPSPEHWLGPFARPEPVAQPATQPTTRPVAQPAAETARQRAPGPLPPPPEQLWTPAPPPNLGALACNLDALSCELDHLASTAGSGYQSATSWHTNGDSHAEFEFARVLGSRMREPMSVRRVPATPMAAAEGTGRAEAAELPARLSAAPELLSAAADEVDSATAHMEELLRRYESEMGLAPAHRTEATSTVSHARQWDAALRA